MNRRSVLASVALSVALAAGMCPVAYAQDADGAFGQQGGALAHEPLAGALAPNALHAHRVYTVPMSLMRADDPESASEAARYFSATAEVRLVDGKYSVRVSPTEAGDRFIAGISYGPEETAAKVVSGRNVVPHVYELLFDKLEGEAPIGFTLVIPGMGQTQRKAVLKLDLDKLAPAGLELDAGTAYVMPIAWQQPGGAPSHAGRAFDTFAEIRFVDGSYDVRITATASMDPLIEGLTYGVDAVAAQVTSADGVSPRQFQLKAATLDEPLKVGFSYTTPDGSSHSQSAELVVDTTQISLAADKSGLESLLASARALKQGEKSADAFAALTAAIAEAQETASNVEATQDEVEAARIALAAAVERFVGSLDQGTLYVAPVSWQQENGSPSHAGRSFDGFAEVRFVDGVYDVRLRATSESDALIVGLTYGVDETPASVVSPDEESPRQFKVSTSSLTERIPIGFTLDVPQAPNHMKQSAYLVIGASEILPGADTSSLASGIALVEALDLNAYKGGAVKNAFLDALAQARKLVSTPYLTSNDQARLNEAEATLLDAAAALESVRFDGPIANTVWKRLAGADALGTMSAVAREGFESADAVVVASAEGYWDALSASALAGSLGAPVLLTSPAAASPEALAEAARLGATRAYVVGGEASVSADAAAGFAAAGLEVVRVSGQDACATAAAVAAELGQGASRTCVVASADGYWDALAAAPYAYAHRAPVLLAQGGELPASTLSAVEAGGYSRVVVAGGQSSVSAAAAARLEAAGLEVVRAAGEDAYGTSAALAALAVSEGASLEGACVASGSGYWDALSGAALAGSRSSVLLLADEGSLGALKALSPAPSRAYVLGGEASVPASVWDYLTGGR